MLHVRLQFPLVVCVRVGEGRGRIRGWGGVERVGVIHKLLEGRRRE